MNKSPASLDRNPTRQNEWPFANWYFQVLVNGWQLWQWGGSSKARSMKIVVWETDKVGHLRVILMEGPIRVVVRGSVRWAPTWTIEVYLSTLDKVYFHLIAIDWIWWTLYSCTLRLLFISFFHNCSLDYYTLEVNTLMWLINFVSKFWFSLIWLVW